MRICFRLIDNKSAFLNPQSAILVLVLVLALLFPAATFAQAPDLSGTWANTIITPLERPKSLGERAFFTDAEAKDFESVDGTYARWKASRDPDTDAIISTEIIGPYTDTGFRKVGTDRRASLLVDPPDGRLPARSPEAQRRAAQLSLGRRYQPPDNPEDLLPSERCLTWGAGPPIMPLPNNSNIQIVQTKTFVAIFHESMHETRIVPLDGRPHLPRSIRLWLGDPRGHWEGNTLVVDTTNLTDKTTIEGAGADAHVIERFTRVNPNELRYEVTVEDAAFAHPWTAAWTMTRMTEPLFEYACHEGNYSMATTLKGARELDRK
ncbi:MAG TPA: hypothetical protein VFA59_03735 [Vicinamibacterales bacterium]|nr:hypothetical protein [Vicinamibacterales bacterium]